MALPGPTPNDEAVSEAPVDEPDQIFFPAGLVGCPTWRRFTLIRDTQTPAVCLLQSLDEPAVELVIADVTAVEPTYLDQLSDDDRAALEAFGVGHAPITEVYCTITVQDSGDLTANLAGPLIIDRARGCGTQLVLTGGRWSARHTINNSTE